MKKEIKIKSDCCNAEIKGVTEYANEEPWGVIGGHWECSKCGQEVTSGGENVERLMAEYES